MEALSARNRSLEHATAAAILVSAALVAAWLLNDYTLTPSEKAALLAAPQPRQAVVEKSSRSSAEPSSSQQAPEVLAIELIDLPAEPPTPEPVASTPASVSPLPEAIAPTRDSIETPREPGAQPPPSLSDDIASEPLKAVEPPRVQRSEDPPQPPPTKTVVPLQPERETMAPTPRIPPLQPAAEQPKSDVTLPTPLRRSAEPRAPLEAQPLKPSPPKPPLEQSLPVALPARVPPKIAPIEPPKAVIPRQALAQRVAAQDAVSSATPATRSPTKPSAEPIAKNVAAVVGEGRAFLRILEQGSGPSIEIEWPSEPRQRDKLYDVLVRCLGMRTAILDSDNRLYVGEGKRGEATPLDSDRYSGFVRRPAGLIASSEQREISRVRNYHKNLPSSSPARIFPRRVDAYLIGGLHQAVGDGYMKMKSIHAAYRLNDGRAVVDSIVADGRPVPGVIDLSTVATGCL